MIVGGINRRSQAPDGHAYGCVVQRRRRGAAALISLASSPARTRSRTLKVDISSSIVLSAIIGASRSRAR